ncbi:bestrophin-like domain [Microvirga sp. P5_D2]
MIVADEVLISAVTFILLVGASLGCLFGHVRLSAKQLQEDTSSTVRVVANIFVVIASLVLGLMLNSAKNTFQGVDDAVHTYATDLILLDKTVRTLGPAGDDIHRGIIAYLDRALSASPGVDPDRQAEILLEDVGNRLRAVQATGDQQTALWNEARQLYRAVLDQRWVIIGQSGGTIPMPLIVVVIAWLVLIFASFGYRSPRNAVVITTLVVAAFLISASLCLILDMDNPSTGLIQVSDEPLQRVFEQIRG